MSLYIMTTKCFMYQKNDYSVLSLFYYKWLTNNMENYGLQINLAI